MVGCMLSSPASIAADHKKECRKLEEKIEYYTDLRRAGGSSKQMNDWYKKRNNVKDRYSEKRCRPSGQKG